MERPPEMQSSGACAPTEVIAMLALTSDKEMNSGPGAGNGELAAWLTHVSQCPKCASMLRETIIDLQSELTIEEQSLADSLVAEPCRLPLAVAPSNRLAKTLGAVAAAALIGMVSIVATRYLQRDEVPDLLAQAYSDTRPFEWRLPDAGYSAVRTQRGTQSGRSSSLLLAKSKMSSGNDLYLGWAQLLESNPSAAIQNLERFRAANPRDTKALVILATAYALRGDLTPTSSRDFRAAIAAYSEVLRAEPSNDIARFNRGLCYQRIDERGAAKADLQALANSSTLGPWRDEVARQLAGILTGSQ